LLAVLVLSSALVVQADPFVRPPEIFGTNWWSVFPYQRNIDMTFTNNPQSSPGSGIPGATYEGTLDSSLLDSDFAILSYSASWFTNKLGKVGIDNTLGTTSLFGQATFHIDDLPDLSRSKEVWVEVTYPQGQMGSFTLNVQDQVGYVVTAFGGPADLILTNGLGLRDEEWGITTNPPSEDVIISFFAPAGQSVYIDELHIATECPEPSTFGLLVAGGVAGLYLLRRRRSQAS
jgi:hypothetical protein